MFNLNQAVTKWRQQMAAGGIKRPAVLDELESHLREDVEQQVQSGINQEQAFEIAARRIGRSNLLKAEFAKIGGGKQVQPGKLIGIACGSFAALFSLWVAPWLLRAHELSLWERLVGLTAVAVTLLSIVSWRFAFKYLPIIRQRHARIMAGIICGLGSVAWLSVFGNLLANVIVPYALRDGGPGDRILVIGISLLWALTLAALFGAVAYGLEEAARRANQCVSN